MRCKNINLYRLSQLTNGTSSASPTTSGLGTKGPSIKCLTAEALTIAGEANVTSRLKD